jgi:hypothetical protein
MNQYKAITRVPHISEPFVDWYDAETEAQAIVEIPCKPWHDFSELVGAIRKCETRKQFDRMESLCDKAYCGGAITAKQLAKLDGLQADCMIERGLI